MSGSARRRWLIGILGIAVAFTGVIVAQYLQKRAKNYDLCEIADPRTLQGPTGDRILMDTRFCGVLTGDPGTIVVRFQPAGSDRGRIIFAYNPTSPEPGSPNSPWYPNVSWSGPHQVLISISQISQLQRQRNDDGDTHFVYHIGKVDYP